MIERHLIIAISRVLVNSKCWFFWILVFGFFSLILLLIFFSHFFMLFKTPHHRSPEGVGRCQVFRLLKHSHTDAMPAIKFVFKNEICTACTAWCSNDDQVIMWSDKQIHDIQMMINTSMLFTWFSNDNVKRKQMMTKLSMMFKWSLPACRQCRASYCKSVKNTIITLYQLSFYLL